MTSIAAAAIDSFSIYEGHHYSFQKQRPTTNLVIIYQRIIIDLTSRLHDNQVYFSLFCIEKKVTIFFLFVEKNINTKSSLSCW